MSRIFQIGAASLNAPVPAPNEGWFSSDRQLPAPRRIVLYETQTTIRVGYIDESQQWRRFDGQNESERVLLWMATSVPQPKLASSAR